MITEMVTVTPEIARGYLTANRDNRNVNKNRVEQYALQMQKGQWIRTGDPVRFDPDGRLLDGQHRLLALIAANVTIDMVIMRDVPTEAFKVLDSGYLRNVGTALGVEKNATSIAAAIRVLWVVEAGGDPRSKNDLVLVTRVDLADYFATHQKELGASIWFANQMSSMFGTGTNKSAWIAFMVLAWRINDDWAHEFHSRIHSGLDLGHGDARLALRNWMIRGDVRDRRAGQHLGFMIKAWNDWLSATRRQIMTFRGVEDFPTLVTERKYQETES